MTHESQSETALSADGRAHKHHVGGRPRLPHAERRSKSVHVTLTEAESEEAVRRAAAVGLGVAQYLRACAGLRRSAADAAGSAGAQETERLALLRAALLHLGRAGSNVNQIARAANTAANAGNPVAPALAGAESAIADLRSALAELRRAAK